MQQVRRLYKNKKYSIAGTLFEGRLILVGRSDIRWNTVEASLVLMYRKMIDLGFMYDGVSIAPPAIEEEDKNV